MCSINFKDTEVYFYVYFSYLWGLSALLSQQKYVWEVLEVNQRCKGKNSNTDLGTEKEAGHSVKRKDKANYTLNGYKRLLCHEGRRKDQSF